MVTNRRVNVVLKEDQGNATNGKQKDSVRADIIVVSGTMGISVQNRHRSPLHSLNHWHKKMEEVRRRKRTSEAGVHLGSSIDSRAKTTWKVFAPNHLVIIGILPNVNSICLNRFVNSATSDRLHTGRLRDNPAKSRRRMVTKVQLL